VVSTVSGFSNWNFTASSASRTTFAGLTSVSVSGSRRAKSTSSRSTVWQRRTSLTMSSVSAFLQSSSAISS
jgi:hypothetical protein